jgi:hypothetical protein
MSRSPFDAVESLGDGVGVQVCSFSLVTRLGGQLQSQSSVTGPGVLMVLIESLSGFHE